ncbi:MAG TPA: TMEM43 family protein [Rhodanobacteraceae bacterium]|nr:TMEM43 family protein [Rhodanobacteraceae bacterium]
MPDSFTDTSTQGFLSRLTGSLAGLLIGPLLVIAAIVLLSWNEGRAVQAIKGLADAATRVVEVADAQPAADDQGKLVHVVGAANAGGAITDSNTGLSFPNEVAVQRKVEMYEWSEHSSSRSHTHVGGSKTTTTTYTYTRKWSEDAIDSSLFKHPDGHANPPMPFSSQRYAATNARLGGYALDATTLNLITPSQTLAPAAPAGWQASDGTLYKGDPASPNVGDLRVSYTGLAAGATLSVLAAQSGDGFAPFATANGYQVQLAEPGNRPAKLMLADKRSSESHLTWILRAVGAIAMFAGFAIFFSPLATLASVLPWLGWLAGKLTGLLALVISVPLTLVVIALAWLAVRPLIGGTLLVLAALALFGLWRMHRARLARRRRSAMPPPPPPLAAV